MKQNTNHRSLTMKTLQQRTSSGSKNGGFEGRCVDRIPYSMAPGSLVFGMDIGSMTAAKKERRGTGSTG